MHLTFQEVLWVPQRIRHSGSTARAMLQVRGFLTGMLMVAVKAIQAALIKAERFRGGFLSKIMFRTKAYQNLLTAK